MENKIANNIILSDSNEPKKHISKAEEKEEMMKLARFLYSIYKNNPELVKKVLNTEK